MGLRNRLYRTFLHLFLLHDLLSLSKENLPSSARTISQIYDFLVDLLEPDSPSDDLIQCISFPPHHADVPSSPRPTKSKGFAFVVFSDTSHSEIFAKNWPWNTIHSQKSIEKSAELQCDHEKAINDARSSGLRCMTLSKWNELADEYRARQKELIELTANSNNMSLPRAARLSRPVIDTLTSNDSDRFQEENLTNEVNEHSTYPPGCLVFVQNILPDTNKTTLRTFFASAFEQGGSEIDYVDFSKGLDSVRAVTYFG